MAPTKSKTQRVRERESAIRTMLLVDALTGWVVPVTGFGLFAVTALLTALDLISDRAAAAGGVGALLLLAAHWGFAPRLRTEPPPPPRTALTVGGAALLWLAVLLAPFLATLFPGAPLGTTAPLRPGAHARLPIGNGRADVVVDAQMPPAAGHVDRSLHYQVVARATADGSPLHLDGDLGDGWQSRRLGRRGRSQAHVSHLSHRHAVAADPGVLAIDDVKIVGVPEATLTLTAFERRTPPTGVLVGAGVLLGLAALVSDLAWDHDRNPMLALMTAIAAVAAVWFAIAGVGHPGLRDVVAAGIVGGAVGTPATIAAAWAARRVRAW